MLKKTNVPERAKGLKSLYNTAEDNTGLGLSVVQEGNVLKIVKASRPSQLIMNWRCQKMSQLP